MGETRRLEFSLREEALKSTDSTQKSTCEVFLVDEDRVQRVRDSMLSDEVIEEVAEAFKVLAHPTRVRIVRALAGEELCMCDLAQVLGISVSATSHQLQALRRMKLVRCRVDGKLAYYSLRDRFISALLDDGVGHVTNGGDQP
jgi:DNA-binding transcriptional ArsR family regulator